MSSPRKHISRVRERRKQSGDAVRRARLPKRMMLATKIADALEARGWKDKDLAERLEKYSSEISKWMKGDHNFTIDTLSDIEEILQIRLLDTAEEPRMAINVFYSYPVDVFAQTGSGVTRKLFSVLQGEAPMIHISADVAPNIN